MEQGSSVGKARLTPDRVWARRAARHTVAFGCSHQTTGAGGSQGRGGVAQGAHAHTTQPGLSKGHSLAPNSPPCTIAPASESVEQQPCTEMQGIGGCLAASESQTATGGAIYASSVLGHPAPCTSPMHFDQQPPKLPTFSAHSIQGNPKICSKYGDLRLHNAHGAGL